MGEVASFGRALYARGSAGLAFRASLSGEVPEAGPDHSERYRLDLARDRGQTDGDLIQGPVGLRRCVWSIARLYPRVQVRHRALRIFDPHHDRDTRRPDLHVPADGSALFSGQID